MTSWDEIIERTAAAAGKPFKSLAEYQHVQENRRYPLEGVFDEEGVDVSAGGNVQISSTAPTFGIVLSEMQLPPKMGDILIGQSGRMNGRVFEVVDIKPDGGGGAELILQEEC